MHAALVALLAAAWVHCVRAHPAFKGFMPVVEGSQTASASVTSIPTSSGTIEETPSRAARTFTIVIASLAALAALLLLVILAFMLIRLRRRRILRSGTSGSTTHLRAFSSTTHLRELPSATTTKRSIDSEFDKRSARTITVTEPEAARL